MTYKVYFLIAACAALGVTATAQEEPAAFEGEPIIKLRLRAEQVNQDGRDDTTALTLAGRLGYQAKFQGGWSALIEAEGVAHLNDDFSDTVDNVPGKAVVADPETIELNRLQVGWKGDNTSATVGRQRIIFDNARFVGNVGFRQNEQTFDAIRLGHNFSEAVTVEYVYIDKVRRIFGDDSPVGEFESDSHVVRVGAKTGIGEFVGTALLLDFENAPGASSQTYTVRWSNKWDVGPGKLGGSLELGQQSEYQGQGPAEDLGYQSYSVNYSQVGVTGLIGMDILEGSGGRGFSTPLATLHAFQGWADVFLATPTVGLRDVSAGVKGNIPAIIPDAKSMSWLVLYHDFDSDNGATALGSEWNAKLRMPINEHLAVEAKGAVFDGATGGPADRTKFWLALEASF